MAHSGRDNLASLDVSNVYIYVGDAVRWDYVPETVLDRGISCRTIAASIHSPTSFASLVTGQYPPNHGVYAFTNRIREDADSLLHHPALTTRFINSVRDTPSEEDPIFSVLNTDPSRESKPLEALGEPFLVMERGPGGHAPYGDFDGTAWEYFERNGHKSASEIGADYEQAVRRDASLFAERLETLEEKGLASDTLVIYTSDHGELLGESGLLGHNGPTRPELIEVPTVFVHPELPNTSLDEGVFRHVDLAPTVLDVLQSDGWPVDGKSLLESWPPGPGLSFYRSQYPTGRIPGFDGTLAYDGVWDADGGHVFANTSLPERLAILAGKALRSSKRNHLRRNIASAVRAYAAGDKTYGSPSITVSEAKERLDDVRSDAIESSESELSKQAEEQLHDLGYMQ